MARIAAAGLVVSAALARRGSVTALEERVFRLFNNGPDAIGGMVWLVMQSGSIGAVAIVAGRAARRGDHRRAVELAAAGTGAWLAVKAIKPVVGRGRPTECLPAVRVRGQRQRGLGYPSGHAAVVTALVLVGADRALAQGVGVAVAAVTSCGRLYTGAHLPLDVVGGVATGRLVADLVTGMSRRVLRP